MNLDKFNSLRKRFENQRFESSQKWTALTLFYGSYLGNLLSIILSYFFIIKLLGNTAVHFNGQEYVLPIFVILFLTIIEFAKRFTLANVVTSFLTVKKRTTSFFIGVSFVVLLVTSTFYLSLSGANTYVNKSEIITTTTENTITIQIDSLNKHYKAENTKLEERIAYLYKAAEDRKNKSLKPIEVAQVKDWEASIKDNNKKLEEKISEVKETYGSKADEQKDQSQKSQTAFILISAFIEILILVGVCFNIYYQYTSFSEQKDALDSNPNYEKLIAYEALLKILYNNGKVSANTQLPSANAFKALVFASTKKYTQKTIKDFLTLTTHLKICQIVGKNRMTIVSYDKAQEILSNYLNLELD